SESLCINMKKPYVIIMAHTSFEKMLHLSSVYSNVFRLLSFQFLLQILSRYWSDIQPCVSLIDAQTHSTEKKALTLTRLLKIMNQEYARSSHNAISEGRMFGA